MRLLCDATATPLGARVAAALCLRPVVRTIQTFPDGETYIALQESLQDEDVFVLSSTVATEWIPLFLLLDALTRAQPRRVFLCFSYCGYSRQERPKDSTSCVSLARLATLLGTFPINKIFFIDLHNPKSTSLFPVPCCCVSSSPIFYQYMKENACFPDLLVAPDKGATLRTQQLATLCARPWVALDKRMPLSSLVSSLQGKADGQSCAIVDDLIDSGRTLCHAGAALVRGGAREVSAFVTHDLRRGDGTVLLEKFLKRLIVTDTLPLREGESFVQQVTVAPVVVEVMKGLG
jgi:ribose-phosphate pyrophosphokinase